MLSSFIPWIDGRTNGQTDNLLFKNAAKSFKNLPTKNYSFYREMFKKKELCFFVSPTAQSSKGTYKSPTLSHCDEACWNQFRTSHQIEQRIFHTNAGKQLS
jgi:hypothetical protein